MTHVNVELDCCGVEVGTSYLLMSIYYLVCETEHIQKEHNTTNGTRISE